MYRDVLPRGGSRTRVNWSRMIDNRACWTGFLQYYRACVRARGSWYRAAWVLCYLSAIQHNLLIPCYHWIVDTTVQLYQLSLPLVSLVMFSMIHSKCYPSWYTRSILILWRLRSFELSLEGERVLKIQSESNEHSASGVPSASEKISTQLENLRTHTVHQKVHQHWGDEVESVVSLQPKQ